MHYNMIIGFVSFIVFLFILYTTVKDDFVFLRRNVEIEHIFNTVFLGIPLTLFFARLFFVLFHPKWAYLNPLVFFVIPYFPGLFAGGGIIGAILFLYLYTKNK